MTRKVLRRKDVHASIVVGIEGGTPDKCKGGIRLLSWLWAFVPPPRRAECNSEAAALRRVWRSVCWERAELSSDVNDRTLDWRDLLAAAWSCVGRRGGGGIDRAADSL